jgi:putative ABC transport system permease protein
LAPFSQAHYIRVAARLKPGVTLARARAQLKLSAAEFRRKFPLFDKAAEFDADPLRDSVVTNVRTALLILGGTVGFVLLIACANVANLQLARGAGRRREIAIRTALGAGRRRIVSQLLAESLLLSIAGGLLGLALGYVGVRALLAINPGDVPRIGEHGSAVTLDWRVLAFTAGVSIITSILFGLIPALSASRIDLSAAIQEGASRSGSSVRQNKARSLLVVTEVALALILLIGAALLIRTLVALRSVDPGIDARSVLTCEMSLSGKRFERTAGIAQMVRDVEQRVGSLPGVIAVASSWSLPLELAFSDSFIIDGRPLANGPVHGVASMRPVSPQFFGVFRIPLLRGRLFTERDDDAASGVVLISQAMAKKFWPAGDPLPDRLSIDKYIGPEFAAPPRRIVGIVGDARDRGLNATRTDDVYSTGAGSRWNDRARRAHSSSYLGDSHEDRALLVVFAGIALGLAAIGIHGLMAYSVQQCTQEMGVRMALGATPEQLRNMVVFQGMRLALSGVVLGVAASLGLSRVMESLIYGVNASDPIVFSAVCLLLTVVALVATYIPSRRATRIDPVEALRHE